MAEKLLRAVVLGASSLLAKELVEEISGSAGAAWDLQLLDEDPEAEGKLTAAGDEAVVIQTLSAEALAGADLVFFAGEAALAEKYGQIALQQGAAVIDLTGALEGQPGFLIRSAWAPSSPKPDLTTAGVVVPQPAALMLALVAQRLQQRLGKVSLTATVLEPASQAGAAGVDELHQQSVSLLSFQEVPRKVFDTQVAFNVQGELGPNAHVSLQKVRSVIRRHTLALVGGDFSGELNLAVLQAPVFHGYVLSVLASFEHEVGEGDLRAVLESAPFSIATDTTPSNQAAVETGNVLVRVEPQMEEPMRHWLLLAGDNLRLRATSAISSATELAALRPGSRIQ